jgi:hypothetical protein
VQLEEEEGEEEEEEKRWWSIAICAVTRLDFLDDNSRCGIS